MVKVSLAEWGSNFLNFFRNLFSSDFMPHGHCYFWRPEIVWLHVLSNAGIVAAYFSIPIVLLYFMRRRKDLPFHWVFGLFAAFIFLCGTTHIMDIVTLWLPVYRLDVLIRAVTAVVSIMTAFAMIPLIPQALAMRSPKELEAKNRELEIAYEKVKESEKLKDDFLATISHELRTPLTLILAPLETLLDDPTIAATPAHHSLLKTMHNNSVRLLQMITGLLDFSRLRAGKIEMRRESTKIVSLTRSILTDFRPLIEQKKLHVTTELLDPEPNVMVDRYLYERIVFNLLSNAIKFSSEGGALQLKMEFANDRLRIAVKDSGIGIAEQNIPLLFQRFHQVDETATRRFEGAGLGLSIVREFTERLSGTIAVESELGKGSTFTVQLLAPRTDTVPTHASSTVAARPTVVPKYTENGNAPIVGEAVRTGKVRRILVAEDNPELGRYIVSVLIPLGQVRLVSNGEEALKTVQSWRPDLILSDVIMPGMDGLELCRQLKANQTTSMIPFVLLTALTHREAVLRGWQAGANEYLFKPFHPTELATRMRSMLQLLEQRERAEEESNRRAELEQFAYVAAHDLKEPLRTLVSMSQLLQLQCAKQLDDRSKEYFGYIVEAAARMQTLIEDLAAYSLVVKNPMTWEPVDINEVVQQAAQKLHKTIGDSQAQLKMGTMPTIRANHEALVGVFEKIISNSLKFRRAEPPQIEITSERLEDSWLFSVSDNGIGFSNEFAETVFVVFKRLHRRDKYPGNGIGLAICRRSIERLGGRIWATSEPDSGTVIRFTLPIENSTTGAQSDAAVTGNRQINVEPS